MTEHIDEVKHHDIQVVLLHRLQLRQQFIRLRRRVNLMIRERVLPAIAFQLGTNQRLLVQVLAFLLVLVDP